MPLSNILYAKKRGCSTIHDILCFAQNNPAETAANPPALANIGEAERTLHLNFGDQLVKYLQTLGHLSYKNVSFFGVTPECAQSSLVRNTLDFHKQHPNMSSYVVVEHLQDGRYVVVDSTDHIRICDPAEWDLIPLRCTLFSYMMQRLQREHAKGD